jgi:outer membrane protein assembly factor BamB
VTDPKQIHRSLSPLSWIGIAAWIAVPVARWYLYEIDHQFANLAGGGLGLIGSLLLGGDILRLVSWRTRIAAFVCLVGSALLGCLVFEFRGFTGETWPVFGLRTWGKAAKESALPNAASGTPVDSALAQLAASASFSQFLGNDRNGLIRSDPFETDWLRNPPKMLWKRPVGEGWAGFAVGLGNAYTLFQEGPSEVIAAFDLLTGEERWRQSFFGKHSDPLGGVGPRSTPTIFQNRLVCQTATGLLVCMDAKDGNQLWSQNLTSMGFSSQTESEDYIKWGRSGSPLIFENGAGAQVVIPLGGKDPTEKRTLAAFDFLSGALLWTSGSSQISFGSPSIVEIGGTKQIVVVGEGAVSGFDSSSGEELWSAAWPSSSKGDACASQPVSIGDNRILLGKGYAQGSKLVEIRRNDGKWETVTIWENARVLKTKFTNAILLEQQLFGLSDGILECVDPENGKRVWKGGRFGQGQLLVVNGKLLILSEDGRIALADPEGGGLISELPALEGVTWNYPAVAGPFLLVRNASQMACFLSRTDIRDASERKGP